MVTALDDAIEDYQGLQEIMANYWYESELRNTVEQTSFCHIEVFLQLPSHYTLKIINDRTNESFQLLDVDINQNIFNIFLNHHIPVQWQHAQFIACIIACELHAKKTWLEHQHKTTSKIKKYHKLDLYKIPSDYRSFEVECHNAQKAIELYFMMFDYGLLPIVNEKLLHQFDEFAANSSNRFAKRWLADRTNVING